MRTEEKVSDGVRQTEDDWRENLVEAGEALRELLGATRRIAVLGMKTEAQSYQPAFYVPQYLAAAGLEVVPVPVYYPEATHILGLKVYRKLADIPGEVDMVDVFRRPQDIPPHLEDVLAKRPRSVWFQSGIRNDAADKRRTRAGHTGEPRPDHPSGARLGGREAQAARARELENELLDSSLVAGEQPLLEPLGERPLERLGSLLRLGLGE